MTNIDEQILNNMFSMGRVMRHQNEDNSSVLNCTLLQLQTLLYLKKNEQVQMSQIADFFHITKPSATSMLNKLVNMKLVKRTQSKTDRRIVHVELTQAGQELLEKQFNQKKESMKKTLAVLSEKDKKDLLRITNILIDHFKNSHEK